MSIPEVIYDYIYIYLNYNFNIYNILKVSKILNEWLRK